MEMLKIIFSFDWEFFSSNWEKCHLNCIGNGALFRPLRHPKKIPGLPFLSVSMENFDGHDPCCFELACAFDQSGTVVFNLFIKTQF